jgi:uncharacterized protein (TIGR00369 family)
MTHAKTPPDFTTHIRRVIEEHIAFNRVLGLQVASMDPNAPKIRFHMRPELVGNPARKILHGGVISATLDVAGGFAVMMRMHSKMDAQDLARGAFPNLGTIDLRVDYLRPGRGRQFEATARVVRLGSRIAVTHMELVSDDGELIATGSAAYVVG